MRTSRRVRMVTGLLAGTCAVIVCGAAALHAADRRTTRQIGEDMQAVGQELAPLFASPQDLFDARKREAAAPKAIPALRKMVALVDELQATKPLGTAEGQERAQLLALLSALGDKETDAALARMAASPVAAEAAAGRSAQLVSRWMRSDADAAVQQKIVDDLQSLAKQYPTQDAVAAAAVMLAGTAKPEAKELRQRVRGIVATDLKTPKAGAVVQQLDQAEAKLEAAGKLKAMEGKPLTIESAALAGSTFSTEQLKGKVVLVDFWATWCVPCREELPRLKAAYAKYHDKGLEIVGVSCDNDAADLRKFLAENKDMPWPQLFDAAKPGWHPVAAQYGINSIPRLFLIDRKGVLRSVDARADYETLIPQLLSEPGK